jgi:hypothetical protein
MEAVDTAPVVGRPSDREFEFIQGQHDYYAAYHHHKESMAYAGFTVYAGAAGAALIASGWPPAWGDHKTLLASLAVTGLGDLRCRT